MGSFEHAIGLTPVGEGRWSAQIAPEWAQGRAAFGGLVGAAALRAASAVIAPDRAVRSLVVDFAAPVAPGEAEVAARVVREGRSLSHVEVRVRQGGQDAAIALIAAGTARPSAFALPSPRWPAAPEPDASLALPYVPGATPAFTQQFDYRWASPRLPFSGAEVGNVGGWIRHCDRAPVDAAGLVAFADAWPPPVVAMAVRPVPASTVTWMLDFVGAPPPGGWPGDGWFRYESDAVAAWNGYVDVRASLWAPDGQLVATSSQLVAEFSA